MLDGWVDWVALFAAALLIAVGALSFFGIINTIVIYGAGIILVIGGLAGIIDAFIEGQDNIFLGFVYGLLFIITIALGVTAFYPIPFLSGLILLIPGGITNYIINAVVAFLLVTDAFISD